MADIILWKSRFWWGLINLLPLTYCMTLENLYPFSWPQNDLDCETEVELESR